MYIDLGDAEANSGLFEVLHDLRSVIEEAYGASLTWEDLEGKRACRIADYGVGEVSNLDQHDAYIDWFFDRGSRLRQVIELAADQLRERWPVRVAPEGRRCCHA